MDRFLVSEPASTQIEAQLEEPVAEGPERLVVVVSPLAVSAIELRRPGGSPAGLVGPLLDRVGELLRTGMPSLHHRPLAALDAFRVRLQKAVKLTLVRAELFV